jgi:hypothetical protein
LIILAISTFSSIRAHEVAIEAAQYAPAPSSPVLVQAGTKIQAVLRQGISESAGPGQIVAAEVADPVVIAGRVVIPAGSVLKGKLEQVTFKKSRAQASMNFDVVLLRDRPFTIHTHTIELRAPVESDIDIMGNAIRALLGASIGAATGAQSGDRRVMDWAMMQSAAVTESDEVAIPITVTLAEDLRL